MSKSSHRNDIRLILIVFILSRIILSFFHIEMDYDALLRNWQYLDMDSLRNDLLRGIWYDHTQPPVFNLFLGIVLKLTGPYARTAFVLIFKVLTLANTLLILDILRRLLPASRLPLIISLIYLLSPAAIIFENELFYTTPITLMLLMAARSLLVMQTDSTIRPGHIAGLFIPFVLVCLTRSMYHVAWLIVISILLFYWFRRRNGISILVGGALISILVVGSWYVKNYLIFHQATTSTWMGMNISRNVFHDHERTDSSKIETIEPFSRISAYRNFLPAGYADKYRGLDDKVLLSENKNGSFINEKNIEYIEVSRLYMDASKKEIKTHPLAYLKNVAQSAIIYFAPATRYPTTEYLSVRMRWYDLVFSFNLSHFAKGKQQRRIALTLSAIPKFIFYALVLAWLVITSWRRRSIPGGVLSIFITLTIAYIFVISSFFEHYENMRFRYEAEPLFLIIAALALNDWLSKYRAPRSAASSTQH
jgi:hypothetical protein